MAQLSRSISWGRDRRLILVGGTLEQRAMDSETAQLAPLLAQHFTVLHYDRRGRGDSTDTQPYAVEREIEDIDALITEAGDSAFLFGISSGAALALEAAIKLGDKVKKLAMYEAPYNDDEAARQAWKAYRKQLAEVLAHSRRGDALALFMLLVGMPPDHLDAVALAKAMPHAQHRTLEGQTHEVAPQVLAPVLVEFFKG